MFLLFGGSYLSEREEMPEKLPHWKNKHRIYEAVVYLFVFYIFFAAYWWMRYGYPHIRRRDWERISRRWSLKLETVERLAKIRGGDFPEFELRERHHNWNTGLFPAGINWDHCLWQFVDDMDRRGGSYII